MQAGGPGPVPCTRCSSTTCIGRRRRSIAYDVDFAEADTRTGFEFGGDTWSGKESDQAFIDSVKTSGNVIMLADATYEGEADGRRSPTRPMPALPSTRRSSPSAR